MSKAETKEAFELSERYKAFLDAAKTEREAASAILAAAKRKGFKDIDKKSAKGRKFYKLFRDKVVALAVIGKRDIGEGINFVVSHIDCPRVDLKQNPLYEDVELALFKTHYYGGIRKYQWFARPLALHGRVVKKDGSFEDIVIGESEEDTTFAIADLLPHLARKVQGDKKISTGFEAEKMNILVGSMPTGNDKIKERFKLTAMKCLYEKYGIIEEDLVSAELEVVPAGRARDVGLDRSLIGAYGHDDRICAFTSLEAILGLGRPERTAIALMMDKEEIGSEGSTGSKSRFMEEFVSDLQAKIQSDTSERAMRKVLMASAALSADVNAGINPSFQEVHEKRNAARIGYGICMTKFTGGGGKSGSNDASAEYVGEIRKLLNDKKVSWQTGELGKVDEGGGGTIAKFMAAYGMETVDCGPAVLSMHSPYEIASKADVYMAYKAYLAFFASFK